MFQKFTQIIQSKTTEKYYIVLKNIEIQLLLNRDTDIASKEFLKIKKILKF